MAARPALVRVKRRRHDPVPADLVLEASGGAESSRTNPVNALAALQLSPPAQKKRRFQLVTTLDSGHTTADDLLHQLACSPNTQDNHRRGTRHTGKSAGSMATYRQVPSADRNQDNIHQHYQVFDLVHAAAVAQPSHLFSGPDEASIIANYYPLVQSYMRQQQHQGAEQPAVQIGSDDLVYDYYVAAADAQTEGEADFTDLPTVQVRDDANWWNVTADAGSDDHDSEDPNAEDWYGNDYPEDDESTDSLHSSVYTTDTSSDG